MGKLSETLNAHTGSFQLSFIVAGSLLIFGALMTLTLRDKTKSEEPTRWGSFVDEFVLGCRALYGEPPRVASR
jgi:hypothetical protein